MIPEAARPPISPIAPWATVSVVLGNVLQIAGMAAGAGIIWAASSVEFAPGAILLLLFGWSLIYLNCHAIAHWSVGRLLGIDFRCYTVSGTNRAEQYPVLLRAVFTHTPFFGVRTERPTLLAASPGRQAAMWSAGIISSILTPVIATLWAVGLRVPGSRMFLVFAVITSIVAAAGNFKPGGDFFKARRAMGWNR